jgi:hypothetical protein
LLDAVSGCDIADDLLALAIAQKEEREAEKNMIQVKIRRCMLEQKIFLRTMSGAENRAGQAYDTEGRIRKVLLEKGYTTDPPRHDSTAPAAYVVTLKYPQEKGS